MASKKYAEIVNLYHHTLMQMTQSPAIWQDFLRSAGRNYKLSFNEQLLVYAQKPEATAVLELDKWNRIFGSYVKSGSRGIAVFDSRTNNEELKYFFDVNDTVPGKAAKAVPVWSVDPINRPIVLAKLAENAGFDSNYTEPEIVIHTAQSLSNSHLNESLTALKKNITGSFLDNSDDSSLQIEFSTFLENSIAYLILSRCGMNADDYFQPNMFSFIMDCDTTRLAATVGNAVSEMAETGLREIAQINQKILSEKAIAKTDAVEYNSNKEQTFGGAEYGNQQSAEALYERRNGNQLHPAGGLLYSGSDSERNDGGRSSTSGTVGAKEVQLPERTPVRDIHRNVTGRDTDTSPTRSGRDGQREDGHTSYTDGESRGRDGATESRRPDEMGRLDEQHLQQGEGNRGQGTDLQLNTVLLPSVEEQQSIIQEAEEIKSSAFSVSQEEIDSVLQSGSGYREGKYRIYEQFQKSEDSKANIAFLRKEYNYYGHSYTYFDGTTGEIDHGRAGITFKKYDSSMHPVLLLKWTKVEIRLRELIQSERYFSPKEKEDYPLYQEMQLQEAIKQKQQHFIDTNRKLLPAEKRDTLALRLADFIRTLPGYEKKFLQEYNLLDISSINAEEMKPHLQNPAKVNQIVDYLKKVQGATTGVYERSNAWAFQAELAELFEKQLVYNVGDTVTLGASTYEILQITKDMAVLSDTSFPLFTKEFKLEEFEKCVRENGNDHLIKLAKESISLTEAKRIINSCMQESYADVEAEADFTNLSKVDIAFITTEDDEHEVQISVNLIDLTIDSYVDDILADRDQLKSLESLLSSLESVDLDELIYSKAEDLISNYLLEYQYVNDCLVVRNIKNNNPDELSPIVARVEPDGSIVIIDEDLPKHECLAIRRTAENDLARYRKEAEANLQGMFAAAEQAAAETDKAAGITQDNTTKTAVTTELPAIPAPAKERKAKSAAFHPEIPQADRHQFHITDDNLGVGSPSAKLANNLIAIRTLKQCEAENRLAAPQEQESLSRYIGWGGLASCFEEKHAAYQEIKSLLTESEYAQARESSLTAFYTPPIVIRSIYNFYEKIGFRGNLLEPACGTGNFIGMMPEEMQKSSKIYGVELDSITGRIAQQLYQKSNIAVQGFEKTETPDSFFDGAVGNVPFGDISVMDSRYNTLNLKIHDYFFAKTLDKLRPGGVMAFITSKGTLDKRNGKFRKYLAQRADLIGAVRLPNSTFKANAGTEVTSDILFLQKRDRMVDIEADWVHLNTDENGVVMNSYFVEHPEMILGSMAMVSGPFGPESTCKPTGDDLEEQLNGAIQRLQADFEEKEISLAIDDEDELNVPADPGIPNYSFGISEGKLYYRENSRMQLFNKSVQEQNRVRGMVEIRNCLRNLIELQTEDYPDSLIQEGQIKLNQLYDTFSKQHGLISSKVNKKAFETDGSYPLLASLEELDDEGNFKGKSAIFSKRTIRPKKTITQVDTPPEALAVSIGEKACVDMPFMCMLTGKTELKLYKALQGVIFVNPEFSGNLDVQKYLSADEYLSGDVKTKLSIALQKVADDSLYEINVEYLKRVIPKDLTASEISVSLGSTWIPKEDVEHFIFELLSPTYHVQQRITLNYYAATAQWSIQGKFSDRTNIKVNQKYGSKRANAYEIIEDTLNLRDTRVYDYVEEDGKKKAVLNAKETAIAQDKQQLIKDTFKDWIFKDQSRRQRLVQMYNDKFNRVRPREYDGSHIQFYGMNPEIQMKVHQQNAVARVLYGGNALLAHVVGAGKTFEMVAAAQESKRLGLCQKSLFVVPNHLTEQWAGEYLLLYPAANILVAAKKDFETLNRKKFCARIATGDYDAIIIGQSQFEKIPISDERQKAYIEREIDDIMLTIAQAKQEKAESFTIKQMEKTRKNLETRLEKLNDHSRKDQVVTFEQLGVDRIFIDESHYYKNLFLQTKMRNVAGIAQTEAKKSSDLFVKCQYLDEITGGRGVVFATGTPISNSMVEMYTIQRYLQYGTLQAAGLEHFDSWASTFGETVTAIELAPEGTGYRSKTRFAKFHNLPELINLFKEVADVQTADMLKLPVPEVEYRNISLKPSEFQRQIVESLAERAEMVRNKAVNPSVDNMLKITNDGRKLALDQRLVDSLLPDDDNGKVSACAENVFKIWEDTAENKSTQLIFSDLSTPGGKSRPIEMHEVNGVYEMIPGQFTDVYNDLKYKLVAKGIPENEIAFIHDANTEVQKKELFKKVINGQVRVLLGSTAKMGAGTNVQEKLIALHHLDCPWRPSDLQQREGRIIRQGNKNPLVQIFTYVTENTFDAYLYQLVETKQKFIAQIMTSKTPVRSAEDVDETALSYAEVKALAAGNPYIKEKMDLDIQVAKLKMLKANFMSEKYELEDNLAVKYPQQEKFLEQRISDLTVDIKQYAQHKLGEDDFKMTLQKQNFTDKKLAGEEIIKACRAMVTPDPILIGSYQGFDLLLHYDTFAKEHRMTLKHQLSHFVSLGTDILGNITRLNNRLNGFEESLVDTKEKLTDIQKQIAVGMMEVEKPWPQEDELDQKMKRLAELNSLLNVDKQEKNKEEMER